MMNNIIYFVYYYFIIFLYFSKFTLTIDDIRYVPVYYFNNLINHNAPKPSVQLIHKCFNIDIHQLTRISPVKNVK